jgi:hypothetical protein
MWRTSFGCVGANQYIPLKEAHVKLHHCFLEEHLHDGHIDEFICLT